MTWISHYGMCSKSGWIRLWATFSSERCPCTGPGGWTRWSLMYPLTQTSLWFYVSIILNTQKRNPSTERVRIQRNFHYFEVLCHHGCWFSFWVQTSFKQSITVHLQFSSCIWLFSQEESLIFPQDCHKIALVRLWKKKIAFCESIFKVEANQKTRPLVLFAFFRTCHKYMCLVYR